MHLDPVTHAHKHMDRMDDLDRQALEVHADLLGQAWSAFDGRPETMLPAPRHSDPANMLTAAQLFAEDVTPELAADVLRILSLAGKSTDPCLRLPAQSLIARTAKAYADWYADIVVATR